MVLTYSEYKPLVDYLSCKYFLTVYGLSFYPFLYPIFPLFLFLALPHAYRILVPQPGIEPKPPEVEAQSLNHWTSRGVLHFFSAVLAIASLHFIQILKSACQFPHPAPQKIVGILIWFNLFLDISLGRNNTFIILSLSIRKNGLSLHLFNSSINSLNNIL